MQKVEGSNPFSRFREGLRLQVLLASAGRGGDGSRPFPAARPAFGSGLPCAMASGELSRRVGNDVGYPPLRDMGADQRREFYEALLDADAFEDLPGRWQVAIAQAEQNRPELRVVGAISSPNSAAVGYLTPFSSRSTDLASCSR